MQKGFAHRLATRRAMFGRAAIAPGPRFRTLLASRWLRGAASAVVLCSALALLNPGVQPLASASTGRLAGDSGQLQQKARGGDTSHSMAAAEQPWIDLDLETGEGEQFWAMLVRAGAIHADAGEAGAMIESAVPDGIAAGTAVALRLGEVSPGGTRPIERITLRPERDQELTIERGDNGFLLSRRVLAVDGGPLRIRGQVGDGLYWSLRAAGASPATAAEYLQALAQEIDVGEIAPHDHFDLVLGNEHRPEGDSPTRPLLYAGLDRTAERGLKLVRWNLGGEMRWIEASSLGETRTSEAVWPVAGRITSGFGYRVHPIFRFARFHSGVDFAAPWGTPIVATGDGQVIGAGWNGGYGRQVRIAHGAGMVTTYSHMSGIAAEPGTFVRSGQVIGYVGSSGLSTGPHLHYEVYQHGRAINPLSVRFASRPVFDEKQRSAIEARLNALLKVGEKRA